jgi:hypothetical protein
MPSIQSDSDSIGGASITQAIGNLARAATTRHRHSATLSSSSSGALPLPQTPQHTNAPQHRRNRASGDLSTSMPSHSPSMSHLDTRRLSTASTGSASGVQDGPVSSLTIEFDGGTHVIVRPNRVVRGK